MLSKDVVTFLSPADVVDAPDFKTNIEDYLRINIISK